MKRYIPWSSFFLLVILAFSMQSCLGIGDKSNNQNAKTITTTKSGQPVSINQTQDLFKGKLYFTIDRNIWMVDGKGATKQLTNGLDARDPAVSPDGKTMVFIVRFKDYANLEFMPASGGPHHTLITGNGRYYNDGQFVKSSYYWMGQPTWSADGSHLLFLSDAQKEQWYSLGGFFANAPFLDLQVFSAPFKSQSLKDTQVVGYANFGDGGDRDPSYRPGHPNQIIYTHYAYDPTGTQQFIQIFLEDATAIPNHPGQYTPLADPAVPLTPSSSNTQNLQPAFSPDGNSIVYIRREPSGQMGLYIMAVPDGVTADPNNPAIEQKALVPYQQSSHILSQQFISQPVWSPDGKQVAYMSFNNGAFDIWLVNITYNAKTHLYNMTGTPTQLTTGGVDGDSRPFWTA